MLYTTYFHKIHQLSPDVKKMIITRFPPKRRENYILSTIELIYALEKTYSPSKIVELLDNFRRYDLDEYALQNNICIICYSELSIRTWKEGRGEHFGYPAEEEMSEIMCEECGKVY